MKLKLTLIAGAVLFLAGCSTTREYQLYSEAHRARIQAEAVVEAARWNALAEVAKSGDATAKVAVAMAVQASALGRGGAGPNNSAVIAPPKSTAEVMLQWGNLVLPNFVQFYGINRNSAVAMRQSDNATALGITQSNNQANVQINTNSAFVGMATAGLTTANSIAQGGFTGIANVANTGLASVVTITGTHANTVTNLTNAHSNAISTLSNTIPLLQPNVTTTTTNNNSVGDVTGNVTQ